MNDPNLSSQDPEKRIRHHWSFIRVGLWVSLAILFALVMVGIWSYQQTNHLIQQSQERTGKALTSGLANAVEENLIVRNFAQLEVELLQFMANEQIQSALVTDSRGIILSEVRRDPQSGNPVVIYNDTGKTLHNPQTSEYRHENSLVLVQPSGSVTPAGWVKLVITMTSDSALLEGIHQKLSLILGLSALLILIIVGFSLRQTYSQVRTSQNEIETLNDSLHAAAFYDALTALPNRHLLKDRLKQALALSARSHNLVAVCYLDLDGFKAINDNYGHDAGDALLVEIGKRLTLALRQHDTVARIGGDEFVLVITELHDAEDYQLLLKRILMDITNPIDIGNGHAVTVSCSIGVACSHRTGGNSGILLSRADKAMYAAKHAGKNRWIKYDEANESVT